MLLEEEEDFFLFLVFSTRLEMMEKEGREWRLIASS